MQELVRFQLVITAVILSVAMLEAWVLHVRKPGTFEWSEAWLSIGDLIGRTLLALLPLNLAAPVFSWAWDHRVFTVDMDAWAAFLALFLGLEFCYYWYHRTAHRMRFFWATHSVHHSPNQLTLSTAFRLGWTGKLTGTGLFFTPLALIGFEPKVVLTALSLNLLYQFWIHATWIPRLGVLEYVLNTPSAHRVHHASNLHYLDANYGGVLIVFDRLFGTYVRENDQEPCVYGLVEPMRTRNLLTMEFRQWSALWRDICRVDRLRTALALIVMPPGWSPDGRGQTTEEMRRQAAISQGDPATVPAGPNNEGARSHAGLARVP